VRWLVAFLIACTVVMAACSESPDGKFGERLFGITCSGCHLDDLSGGFGPGIGPRSNAHLNLTDEQIRGVISVGPGAMPPFGTVLDERQIDSLVLYLRSVQVGSGS